MANLKLNEAEIHECLFHFKNDLYQYVSHLEHKAMREPLKEPFSLDHFVNLKDNEKYAQIAQYATAHFINGLASI